MVMRIGPQITIKLIFLNHFQVGTVDNKVVINIELNNGRIRKMRLVEFVKVVDLFKVGCREEKLEENEPLCWIGPLTLSPLCDEIVKLVETTVSQETGLDSIPPPKASTKKSAPFDTSGEASVSSKSKVVDAPPTKRLKSSVKMSGARPASSKKPCGQANNFEVEVASFALKSAVGSSCDATNHQESTSPSINHQEIYSSHILGVILAPVKDSTKTLRQDKFYVYMSVGRVLLITLPHRILLRLEHTLRIKERLERRFGLRDAAILEKEAEIIEFKRL
ncbi:hypothetical protein Tco_1053160 [Tanacetum coccineum]